MDPNGECKLSTTFEIQNKRKAKWDINETFLLTNQIISKINLNGWPTNDNANLQFFTATLNSIFNNFHVLLNLPLFQLNSLNPEVIMAFCYMTAYNSILNMTSNMKI